MVYNGLVEDQLVKELGEENIITEIAELLQYGNPDCKYGWHGLRKSSTPLPGRLYKV